MDWELVSSSLWWLAIGAAFYWMMRRGGCGMHAGHSAHGGHQHGDDDEEEDAARSEAAASAVRDPVCGMMIDPEHAAGMRTLDGRNLFLCSARCVEKFDAEPSRYATPATDVDNDADASANRAPDAHRRHAAG